MVKRASILTILILQAVILALGQEKQEPKPAQNPQPQKKSPDWVDFSGFKGKIFEIKYADPKAIANIVYPLGSGFKGAIIQPFNNPNSISVRDFPENIAIIEEAIKRLDVPQPVQAVKVNKSPDVDIY